MMWKSVVWSALALLTLVSTSPLSVPALCTATEIVAHRGASFEAPENTRASVELAWKQQAHGVEVDVYLSADGHIFAMHDKTAKRYGGPDRPVSEMSWTELKQLDVGAWKDERWRGEKIPLLAELLPLTPENGRMFIEIKCGPEIIPELKRVLAEAGLPAKQTAIICFSQEVIAAVRKELPELEAYWLASIKLKNGKPTPSISEIITTARKLDVPAVDLGGYLTREDVQQLKAAGFPCYVWTVNDPARAQELIQWGVVGITTDKPALLLEETAASR